MTNITSQTPLSKTQPTNPTQPKLVPNPTQRCYAPDKIYNRTSQTSIYKDVYISFSANFLVCGEYLYGVILVVLTPTFLPGSRVDDFYCCSSSSTGRRTKDGTR